MTDARASALTSVVIPTYNVGTLVREAVLSVLAQTHADLEVIVVDDGSTDQSIASLEGISDARLKVVRQANRGLSGARNTGFEQATGDYVAFLDADDLWFPTKLERTLPFLNEHAAVGNRMQYIGETGRRMRGFAGQDPEEHQHLIRAGELMPFPISSAVFHRKVVEQAGSFDEGLEQVEDLDFLLRVARHGSIGWLPDALGGYRLRTGSMSAARFGDQRKWAGFVAGRTRARDNGGDLSWEAFDATYRLSPKERRAERGAAHYRRSGLLLANGDVRGLWAMAQAVATTPGYAIQRLARQLRP